MEVIRNKGLKNEKLLVSIILYIIGVVVMPMGVVFTINAHMGAGGYDALNFALAEMLGIKTSYAIYGTALIAVFVAAAVRRGMPRFTTFLSSLFIGVSTDLWKNVFADVQGTGFISSAGLLCLGIILIGFAVAAYMLSGLPTNPTDDLIVACRERNISIRAAKITMDVIFVLLAFVLGGEIGAGTIVCTFLLGPVIDAFYHLIGKMVGGKLTLASDEA